MTVTETEVRRELDQLFRQSWGQMVAALTRILGTQRLDQAEALVQEAFVVALKTWAFQGIPESPVGWLITTAKNRALDQLKHERVHTTNHQRIRSQLESWADHANPSNTIDHEIVYRNEIKDDLLRMMYVCCFPELNQESQVALIMKNLCSLSMREIARGFLQKEKTVEQRLTRAKNLLRDKNPPFEIPELSALSQRTAVVLDALYFLFNEGYSATEGETQIRRDLCSEAIRLLDLVLEHPLASSPAGHALQALFCLQASRFDARLDASGDIVLLADQDRLRWDQKLLGKGIGHLKLSMAAEHLSVFHLEAGIAAEYATAPSLEATNWNAVIRYYDALCLLKNSPIAALNRAIAVALSGDSSGLHTLHKMAKEPALRDYHLLYAAIGELERRSGNHKSAFTNYEKALQLARTAPEQRFLKKKIADLR